MAGNIRIALVTAWIVCSPAYGAAGAWSVETRADPASYQVVSLISAESLVSISDEYGVKEVNPALEFRCLPNSPITVRIDWLRFISSFNTEIGFIAGDGEPLTLKFGVDRSNKITATRSAEDDAAILALLSGQQLLKVRVTPYSEVPVEVQFDLGGLEAGLADLRQACASTA